MPYWHEVAVFQLTAGGFAASLKTFFKNEGRRDAFRAERFANADDVVGWLRGIDPADDLPPESPPRSDDAEILESWSQKRRQSIDDIRQSYRTLIERLLPAEA